MPEITSFHRTLILGAEERTGFDGQPCPDNHIPARVTNPFFVFSAFPDAVIGLPDGEYEVCDLRNSMQIIESALWLLGAVGLPAKSHEFCTTAALALSGYPAAYVAVPRWGVHGRSNPQLVITRGIDAVVATYLAGFALADDPLAFVTAFVSDWQADRFQPLNALDCHSVDNIGVRRWLDSLERAPTGFEQAMVTLLGSHSSTRPACAYGQAIYALTDGHVPFTQLSRSAEQLLTLPAFPALRE